ncbi:hypothetical protein V8G61_06050 [Gaetbulibacter sp. M240]|uniref:hypothetical protein n=1 Tax=Gaetbulibacter sp. M240 TaxID=3126511 RepID=UPI00374EF13E
MKTTIHILILVFFSSPLWAQQTLRKDQKHSEKKELTFQISNGVNTQFEPVFSGLFQSDFNGINKMIKWQNIYDDIDVGIRFSLVIPMNQKLNIKTRYLCGLMNFDKRGFGQAEGYQFQMCISYNL